ncbi:MAG: A/G-specific adenine glycosylase [Candidatus Eremiobacteraeota bacterium]|nr:A/G-specific adenine glycosylase [Candidatus Eremiobacteraeota bacterium]
MSDLQRALLEWYARCGRAHLPWRTTRDPYLILVSEFMLQQTQVDRVLPKFAIFVERFPTFRALAENGAAEVVRYWHGLGYNSRAVRLHAIARIVVERYGGKLPAEVNDLQSLPGVGPYTASAVRAFAFDRDDAAVDTNVLRVVHRWKHGVEYPPKATRAQLDDEARHIVPPGRGHDWNSAMMDLGATVCTARAPKCGICPVALYCKAAPLDAAALDSARRKYAGSRPAGRVVPFSESTRYARGRIVDRLRALPEGAQISLLDLHSELGPLLAGRSVEQTSVIVDALERDALVTIRDGQIALRD